MKDKRGLSSILCLLMTCSAVSASNYYISPSGNDRNPGALEAPFRSIGKATSVMQSGDRCLIHAGTYRETITPKTDSLTFGPYEDDRVEINGMYYVNTQGFREPLKQVIAHNTMLGFAGEDETTCR